jgi:hypothetical protein
MGVYTQLALTFFGVCAAFAVGCISADLGGAALG